MCHSGRKFSAYGGPAADRSNLVESSMSGKDDFRPTASWELMRYRADLLHRLRQFFVDREFLEVETPLLSADTVVDRHLDPLSVMLFDDPRWPNHGRQMWLQTSPEFGMKRLLADESPAIYQITRAFRAGESGHFHNPEFTIVEWYRRGDSMHDGMELLSDLCEWILGRGPSELVSYAETFKQHLGIDPHSLNIAEICARSKELELQPPATLPDDRDEWLNWLLAECVQPNLGQNRPVIVYDYPASQAALSQVRDGSPAVAERFELYVEGVELANGYNELLDPVELARRNRVANAQRTADGKYPLPENNRLISAMEHGLPSCTGVALGFDRLLMVATGASSIADVMAFPIERA